MSTPLRTSYPVPVTDLLPAAQKLAADLGSTPSRNRIMKEFRIGADKARLLLDALAASASPGSHLHAVPNQPMTGATVPVSASPTAPQPGASVQVTPHTDPVSPVRSGWRKWAPRLLQRGGISPADETTTETDSETETDARPIRSWPVLLLALPAFVAVWSGWVGLGELTGFGVVHPLPGIADGFTINSAITLPIGVETYAAFALRVWLSGRVPARARRFAKRTALSALALGALGQVAYHLLDAQGVTSAPWPITTAVACLPVAVLGMGAALAHLIHTRDNGSNR
ncbi:ABC transporter permease [Kribbella sp. NPDC056951]|uniref:ABC transporter permease n=1 Tax=Kribbella sp. NPDC056951 TaxID=3345978 RepID=UPI003640DC2C